MEDELAAADGAVRTHRARHFGAFVLRTQFLRALAHRFGAGAVATVQDLPNAQATGVRDL